MVTNPVSDLTPKDHLRFVSHDSENGELIQEIGRNQVVNRETTGFGEWTVRIGSGGPRRAFVLLIRPTGGFDQSWPDVRVVFSRDSRLTVITRENQEPHFDSDDPCNFSGLEPPRPEKIREAENRGVRIETGGAFPVITVAEVAIGVVGVVGVGIVLSRMGLCGGQHGAARSEDLQGLLAKEGEVSAASSWMTKFPEYGVPAVVERST
jgi:hypothetical protein